MDNPFSVLLDKLEEIEEQNDAILSALDKLKIVEKHQQRERERFVDKHEACAVLGVSMSTINNMMRDDILPFQKSGKNVRFRLSDLYELAEKRKRK